MPSDKVLVDLNEDFDNGSYKSCFARSVAVNSQYKSTKLQLPEFKRAQLNNTTAYGMEADSVVRLRKRSCNNTMDENRRLSCSSINSSRRTSICSTRIPEIPVENFLNQSKVETLQWQLKEIEKSREMYRAVMKQVVTFLERAHRNLELLGTKLNTKQTVPRSKSEHQITVEEDTEDYSAFRDFTWRRPKKQELSSEEIPPEKLSQEAFRLLRTAQSLLNTQEPKLAHQSNNPENDIEFLSQLAKEFPQTPEAKPQRTTSFSLSPKLITPENDIKTAFNRKLSLQLNEAKRTIYKDFTKLNGDFLSSTVQEKSSSPPAGSVSSVEDESGFSSMNSFQDVGLPLINNDEVNAKNVLLKSMLHNSDFEKTIEHDDVKLWQKPAENVSHKRWNSTPAGATKTKQSNMKVLWV